MKRILVLIIIGWLFKIQLFAQPTGPQGDASYTYPQINGPVINGIPQPLSTDPRNISWPIPPYNPDFKRNRFPWFSEQVPNTNIDPFYQYKFRYKYPATIQEGEIRSPYAFNDAKAYTNPLRFPGSDKSPDYLPEDGWELVKQSMGYLRNDNTGLPKPDGVSAYDPDPKEIPFVLLYNKFSGNLRILAFGGHLWGPSPEGNIAVNMVLNERVLGATKNYSGLLNAYGETYTPLDKETKVKFVQSLAVYPGSVGFFWADFQMAYDPCVCFYESWVTFDFVQIQTYSIQGFTQSIDLSEDLDVDDVAQYLAAVWKEDRDAESIYNGMLNYKNGTNLEEELKTSINANANYIKKDKMLKYLKILGESLGEIGEGLGSNAKGPKSKGVAKGIKYSGKGIKFFASAMETPMSKATKTAGAFRGTITSTTNPLIVKTDLATPGSWDVKNRTGEFFPDPEYPAYNETFGTIAFLTTPKVFKYESYEDSDCNLGGINFTDRGEHDISLRFDPTSLLFKFNPLLDLKSYVIETGLDVRLFNVTRTMHSSQATVRDASTPLEFYNLDAYSEIEGHLFPQIPNYDWNSGKEIRASSPYFDLSCAGNLVCHLRIDDYSTCFSSQQFLQIWGVELSVIVTGVSNKTDRNGDPITFVQKYSLPVELIPTSVRLHDFIFKNPVPFAEGGIPSDLLVGNHTFNVNDRFGKIYAHNVITMDGIITNHQIENGQKKEVTFAAGSEIEINSGFETRGGSPIILEISSPYTTNCLPGSSVSEVSNQFVTSFCKKSNPTVRYAANFGAPRLAVDNSNLLPPIISDSKMGYPIPNPTTGICSIDFDLAAAGGYEMYMSNSLGLRVKELERSDFAKAGKYSIQFQTEDLEAGVYYITLSSEGLRQARKLVVVK